MTLLKVENVSKQFGGLIALHDVSTDVQYGEIRGLVGPNGAGKSTLFDIVTGFTRATSGRIVFNGKDISHQKPSAIARRGLVRTFQLIKVFGDLKVIDNVVAGSYLYSGDRKRNALEILEALGMAHLKDRPASELSHGEQRLVGVAACLAARPKLLILDEAASGLHVQQVDAMISLIGKIRENGTTIFLCEHDMKVIMRICDSVTVLNFGEKIAEGTAQEIARDPMVIKAYIGEEVVT